MTTPFKWGAEFLVNTTTIGDQQRPAITALADGRFVVSWQDGSQTGGDTSFYSIRAQLFNADGSPFGAEFLVNTTTTSFQVLPAITALADGSFVVSWTDYSQTGGDTSGTAVRAQVFNADGSPSGSEFLVNTATPGDQYAPAITALANGGFVVCWQDGSQTGGDTAGTAVRAQVFGADGAPFGLEILVNTTTTGNQLLPEIAALADGRFVVSLHDLIQAGDPISDYAIRAQVFNADGSPFGAELLLSTMTLDYQVGHTITGLADGRFVVSWDDLISTGSATSDYAIRAQVFNANGSPFGAAFLVNTTTTSGTSETAITALADGRFVASWVDFNETGGATSSFPIRAQVFNADGSASGAEFLVNTPTTHWQTNPTITALADGRFVVSWTDFGLNVDTGDNIRAQIYDPREAAVTLNGTLSDDRFFGTIFADRLAGFFGNDTLAGAAGDDRLRGEVGNDVLRGGQGNDRAYCGDGHDVVRGGHGSDGLNGGSGNDTLRGGTGADALRGGTGQDWLTGGTDADIFLFASAAEAGTGTNRDRITDFAAGIDTLDFSAFMAGGHFIGNATYTPGNGPQLRFATATGILSGDVDGNGTTDFQLKLDGAPVLTAADFLF